MFSSSPTRRPTRVTKPENWHLSRGHDTLIQPPSHPLLPHPQPIETKNHLFDDGLDDRKPTLEHTGRWLKTGTKNWFTATVDNGWNSWRWIGASPVLITIMTGSAGGEGCRGVGGSGPPRGQVKQSLHHYRYLSRSKCCCRRRGNRWWVGDSSPGGQRSKVKWPNLWQIAKTLPKGYIYTFFTYEIYCSQK